MKKIHVVFFIVVSIMNILVISVLLMSFNRDDKYDTVISAICTLEERIEKLESTVNNNKDDIEDIKSELNMSSYSSFGYSSYPIEYCYRLKRY